MGTHNISHITCLRKNFRGGVSQAPRSEADCNKWAMGSPHSYARKKLLENLGVEKERIRLGYFCEH